MASKQRYPNLPLHSHLLQLFQHGYQAIWEILSLQPFAIPGSALRPLFQLSEHLPQEASERHPDQMPEPPHAVPFSVEDIWNPCPYTWAQAPVGGSSFPLLVTLSIFQAPPTAHVHMWGLECRSVHWKLCVSTQLCLVKRPDQPVNILLCSTATREEDPKILQAVTPVVQGYDILHRQLPSFCYFTTL